MGNYFYDMVPQYILYSVKFEIKFFTRCGFVKIPFQPINYPYMLRIYRPNLMKFKDWYNIFFNLM